MGTSIFVLLKSLGDSSDRFMVPTGAVYKHSRIYGSKCFEKKICLRFWRFCRSNCN